MTNASFARWLFAEALESVAVEMAERPDPDPDPWNLPLVHIHEADIHGLLWDPERQEASLQAALDAGRAPWLW